MLGGETSSAFVLCLPLKIKKTLALLTPTPAAATDRILLSINPEKGMANMAKKRIPRCLQLITLLCLISWCSGCAALHGLRESPKISVADIQVQQAGLMENAFLLQLRVMNPNDVAIDLKAITCSLTLDGKPFARGVADSNQRIEAYSSTMVPVSVYSSVVDMAGALARLLQAGVRLDDPAQYGLEGTAILSGHGFEVEKDITSKGELSWQRLKESFTGD